METLKVEANYRSDMSKGHMKKLRKLGYVTGSVFGRDAEPVPIEIRLDDLARQAKQAEAGIKSLIELKIKGGPKKLDGLVILKDFYKDPLSRKVLDVQFQRVNLKEKVSVDVPIVLVGEAVGAKEGGTVEQPLDELHISCLPTDIPPRIEVDITDLAIGSHIRVADLSIPENLEVLTDPDTLVCTCVPPHVHRVEEAAEAEAPTEGAEAGAGEEAPKAAPAE